MAGPPRKKQRRHEPSEEPAMPQKKFYRQRAHANPFSDHALIYPAAPNLMNWSEHYPAHFTETKKQHENRVEIADIGCGYGGLLFALAPIVPPSTLILGMEIRGGVTAFVSEKIKAIRARNAKALEKDASIEATANRDEGADEPSIEAQDSQSKPSTNGTTPKPTDLDQQQLKNLSSTHPYTNISVIRANAMKFLPNFFTKSQLAAIFFCFPDPHFKNRKHKARIVSSTLNSEYAFVLRPGGIVYTITDVKDLHDWMCEHLSRHESFERVAEEEYTDAFKPEREDDGQMIKFVRTMLEGTEEGQKVTRNKGEKFVALFRRLEDPAWP